MGSWKLRGREGEGARGDRLGGFWKQRSRKTAEDKTRLTLVNPSFHSREWSSQRPSSVKLPKSLSQSSSQKQRVWKSFGSLYSQPVSCLHIYVYSICRISPRSPEGSLLLLIYHAMITVSLFILFYPVSDHKWALKTGSWRNLPHWVAAIGIYNFKQYI